MIYEVVNQKNSKKLASRCEKATSFSSRLMGLIGRDDFPRGEGLWFPKCSSIHMWFMKFSIDAVFIKSEGSSFKVVKCIMDLKPWRFFPASSYSATDVIELPTGAIREAELREGDTICISSKS